MQPLTILQTSIVPFGLKFIRPFSFAGNMITERVGYYWLVTASNGIMAQGEIAPLEGFSQETLKKAKHDLEEMNDAFRSWEIPVAKNELLERLRNDVMLQECCSSTCFGIESALIALASQSTGMTLNAFLEGNERPVQSAFLLQGTNEQILEEAKKAVDAGTKIFKLKVGNRNIPIDVKNVQDLRALVGKELVLRLDANRGWNMTEAVIFVECIGRENIEYIEEPVNHMDRLDEFYHATHMPVALDETLTVLRCDVSAPGRCMPTLAHHDGVQAYVIKPVVIGGVNASLDWIKEAQENEKKAILSSCFETPVGFEMVKALASLSDDVAGLGTQRFYEQ